MAAEIKGSGEENTKGIKPQHGVVVTYYKI